MYNYHNLSLEFLQYKSYLGYSYKSDSIILKEIIKFLGDNQVEIITKEVVEKYVRLNPNWNQNTINRNITTFREFNKYLHIQGIECYQIPLNLYSKRDKSFTAYTFTHKEIENIYANLDFISTGARYSYYNQTIYPLIIKLLYQTGIRIGEVLKLRIKDYKYECFILKQTKNNQERKVMIPDSLKEKILDYHKKFHKHSDNDILFFETSVEALEKYLKKVLQKSGIKITDKGPRIHDLRHTFIVHSIEKLRKDGKDLNVYLPVLQAQVGHTSISSTAYYFHLNNDLLHELNEFSELNFSSLIPKVKDGEDDE